MEEDDRSNKNNEEADSFGSAFSRKLISLMEGYPMFYDKKHNEYKDSKLKIRTWKQIAVIMTEFSRTLEGHFNDECNVAACKDAWKRLKDRFTKERGRLARLPSGSGKRNGVPMFPLYNDMLFMDGHITKRTKRSANSSNLSNSCPTNETDNDEEEEEEVLALDPATGEFIEKITSKEVQIPIEHNKKMKLHHKDPQAQTSNILQAVDRLTDVLMKDEEEVPEIRSFTDSIYSKLRTVDVRYRLDYQIAILQAIKSIESEFAA